MSMLIMGASHGLSPEQVEPFFTSLSNSGYEGDFGLISADLKLEGVDTLVPYKDSEYFRSSNRLFLYQEYMQKCGRRYDKVMLTGVRDVLFQDNPEKLDEVSRYGHSVQLYREDSAQTIGGCPYNSNWIRTTYGEAGLEKIKHKPIICAEIVLGTWEGMTKFLRVMTEHAAKQKNKHNLEDQGMLNWLYHTGQIDDFCAAHENDFDGVYTVGYCESITVNKHKILNVFGKAPCVVHQYDRHISSL